MPSTTPYPVSYREWLAKLISFDTVSRNSNLPLIEYVQAYLRSVGIEPVIVYSPEKTHANLWATLPGEGGVTQGGIVLSGHTDVVPVDGQKWDSDPFKMLEKDGKLFGRGACDMKGFLALVLALTPTFLSMKRAKPVHYAFSYDEEVGCTGVPHLTQYLKEHGFKADGCIIGEPSGIQVFAGSKGMSSWSVEVTGKAIHSSMALMNTSCNAIEYGAMIIAKIREIAIDLRDNGPRDPNHTCPFSPITTGLLKGGNAVNTVPAECDFVFSVRVTDTQVSRDIEARVKEYVETDILPAMRKEYKDAKVQIKTEIDLKPFNADAQHEFTKNALRIAHKDKVSYVAGGTEGGYFHELGIPTIVCGPGPLSMAHLPNEYVLVEDMDESTRFTTEMVKLYCTSSNGRM